MFTVNIILLCGKGIK